MPELAYVGCVEISAHDPDTVYLAATRYKLADYRPYLFRSVDGGLVWESIGDHFPPTEITRVIRADPIRPGLLFVGTETGVFFSLDDGRAWIRMPGGLPVVPVYDLKIKDTDLVAGTHGRSFWILDDISPLRVLADANTTQLFAPRTTVRTKLHFGALGGVRIPFSFALTFGIGGGIATTERPDGMIEREHLDVGENPPNGVIVYYWLNEGPAAPVTLTFHYADGNPIVAFRSDDDKQPAARRPGNRCGLNRFVWDMRHPGPTRIDPAWATFKNKPLAKEREAQPGPTVVPGDYRVELMVGPLSRSAQFSILKDPRLTTSQDDYVCQFALLSELNSKLSTLNDAVNRIRRVRRQLLAFIDSLGNHYVELVGAARSADQRLTVIEGVLVDIHRESPRDVLRHTAGLNDTLVDLINTAAIADAKPTEQTIAVSDETMARVDAEIVKLDLLLSTDIANINRRAMEASIGHILSTR
jgi:hypothetical protein